MLIGNSVHFLQAEYVVGRLLEHARERRGGVVRVLELFAGVGAITRCLLNVAVEMEIRVEHTVLVDNNKHAAAVLRQQHPHAVVKEVSVLDLTFPVGGYDVVVAGPPCQSHSVANQKKKKMRSIDACNGALLPFAARAVAHIKPVAWVIENVCMSVRNFTAADDAIRAALPTVQCYQMDSHANFGAAQRRRRLFFSNVDLTPPTPDGFADSASWAADVTELSTVDWTAACQRNKRCGEKRTLGQYMREDVEGTKRGRVGKGFHFDVAASVQPTLTAAAQKGAPYNTVRDTVGRLGGVEVAEGLGMVVDPDGSVWRPLMFEEAERLMGYPLNYTRLGSY